MPVRRAAAPTPTMDPAPAASPIELLRRHRAQIRRLAQRLAGAGDVDDVEQELYVAALERPPRALAALPAWIASTVRNVAAKGLRSRGRRRERERAAASPEPLPPSAELVARVELEEFVLRCVRELPEAERAVVLLRFFEERSSAEIAQRLGLGESTVRARLQRALERLRERLDARSGERERWVRALAPWTLPGGAGALVLAKTAGAVVAVAAAALVLIAVLPASADRDTAALVDALPRAVVSAPASEARVPPEPVAAERRRAVEAGAARGTRPDDPDEAPSGRVKLSVVDGTSGAAIEDAVIRFDDGARFAEIRGAGSVDGELGAGRWRIGIARDGYEPELRDDVEVAAGAICDLGVIALGRGTGAIEGRLRSPDLPAATARHVELRGAGRTPCWRCATREPAAVCCGYELDRTLVQVGEEGRFRFEGLAAGTYFVRPSDGLPRLQPTLRLELARGERRLLDLELAPPVVLSLELLDEAGDPFVGIWSEAGEERPEPIHVDLEVDDVRTGFDATPDPADLRRRIGPAPRGPAPDPAEAAAEPLAIAPDWANLLRNVLLGERSRLDRPRRPDDSLFPRVETPFYAVLELACGRTAPHRYVVRDLPATRVRLKARCGSLATGQLELDLADPRNHRVKLQFARAGGREPSIASRPAAR